MNTVRYVHQVRVPNGFPTADDFAFADGPLPSVRPGTVLVENIYLSVDPYMRQMMDGGWDLHAPLEGRAVGRVLESGDPAFHVGQFVFHREGWRTHALVDTADPRLRVVEAFDGVPLSTHLSILGGTGLSAYVGLVKIAGLRAGESVFISAAAGGVGTAAGQLAKVLGAGRVIGSAGTAAKVRHLVDDLGFDAAFNYKDGPVADQLRAAAPDGIDVYLDNVGGDHLEAAIDSLVEHGRIAWCGAIAQYHDAQPPPAPRNLFEINGKRLRMEGFAVREHDHLIP
ncbi:MAG TPA: NADP-dependent oxidoreductase [Actinokineospora sp.]|nr:NADP-dependent oxidoreductase [Actinokineospora sp.]